MPTNKSHRLSWNVGGQTEIREQTKDVLLESAASNRRTFAPSRLWSCARVFYRFEVRRRSTSAITPAPERATDSANSRRQVVPGVIDAYRILMSAV